MAGIDQQAIQRVRSFNRTVTQRIGVLEDEYLARQRPLGASRVLWEVGEHGTDARTLRARLDLDSGYLSRILRTLEAEGLVETRPSPTDQRVRTAHLTGAGRAEREVLDERSDALAADLVCSLDAPKRAELLDAMATVERLLTAGLIEVDVEDPRSEDAVRWRAEYYAEVDRRFVGGFDADASHVAPTDQLTPPTGVLLLARLHGEAVGGGALRFYADEPAHVKHMWVDPAVRGLGVGRRVLSALEDEARRHGIAAVRLETNRTLHEAIALYRSSGYDEVPAFNDEPYGDHWFEKRL
jgi:DNA-binding MarR family transcriptional regulator